MTVHEAIKKHLGWCGLTESREFFVVRVLLPNQFYSAPGDNLVAFWDGMEAIDRECNVTCHANMLKPTVTHAVFELTWDDETR